jgi:beta-galactosidase
VFNYSAQNKEIRYPFASGKELLSGKNISNGQTLSLQPWDVVIVESL